MIEPRGVIFDMDGVLVNSEPLHLRATQEILAAHGVTLTDEDYFRRYIVYSDRELMDLLLSDATARPAAGTVAPAAASGSGGTAGVGTVGCAAVKKAATTISLEMQLLYQAGSADQWKAVTASTSPIVLSGDRLAAAVDVLATAPGSGDLVAKYREIADLERQAVASGDPWGGGTGPGAQAQKKVRAQLIGLGVGMGKYLDGLGC